MLVKAHQDLRVHQVQQVHLRVLQGHKVLQHRHLRLNHPVLVNLRLLVLLHLVLHLRLSLKVLVLLNHHQGRYLLALVKALQQVRVLQRLQVHLNLNQLAHQHLPVLVLLYLQAQV